MKTLTILLATVLFVGTMHESYTAKSPQSILQFLGAIQIGADILAYQQAKKSNRIIRPVLVLMGLCTFYFIYFPIFFSL